MPEFWQPLIDARRSVKGDDGKSFRQEDLAKAIGCAQQTVSNWETGKWPVPSEYVDQFVAITGCPLELVMDINEQIRERNKRSAVRLHREGVGPRRSSSDMWVDAVASDEALSPLLRSVLLFLPRFVQIAGSSEVAVDREQLLRLADVNQSNLMDVWIEVLSSGYVSGLGNDVYVLTLKKKK